MAWAMVFVVLPLIIGMLLEVFKKLALPGKMPSTGWPGWQGVYFVSYKAHALAMGALFGVFMFESEIPWPKEVFGPSLGSAVLAGVFAGGVSMVAYASIVGTIRNLICQISLRPGGKNYEGVDADGQ